MSSTGRKGRDLFTAVKSGSGSLRFYHEKKRVAANAVPARIRSCLSTQLTKKKRARQRAGGGSGNAPEVLRCYCSYKCGCREQKVGDTPTYDEATGMRFCQPRDKAAFSAPGHMCHLKAYQDADAVNLCPPLRTAGSTNRRRVLLPLLGAVAIGGIAGASLAAAENERMRGSRRRAAPAGLVVVYWEGYPYLFDPFRGYYVPWLNDFVPQMDWRHILRQSRVLDTCPAELFASYERWRRAMSQ